MGESRATEPRGRRLVLAGITTLDLVHRAERLPDPGGKQAADSSYFDVGGPAANAAITASILGADVLLHSVLGTGPLPDYARSVLDEYQVEVRDHAGAGAEPPVASIWVDGLGERTILSTDNTSVAIDVAVDQLLPADTAAVLLDGHYPEIALTVAATATAAGIPITLDCGRWRPVYAELLPQATDIIMCETFRPPEMRTLTAEEAVVAIYERWRPGLCAMTRGADDVLSVTERGLTVISVTEVDAVDTMGAGDVFHGAYLYERHGARADPLVALETAVAAASESCKHLGVRERI